MDRGKQFQIKLFQRPGSPNWHAKIKLPGRDRIRKSTGTSCQETAFQIAQAHAEKEWHRHTHGESSVKTFAEAVMAYVDDGGDDRFLTPLVRRFGQRVLSTITPADIRQAALDLHPTGRPETLQRNVITPMRAVILFAHDQSWCPPIRVKGFTEAKLRKMGHHFAPKRERVAITWEWIDAFRAHASNPYLAALALFMFTTGTRIGSACQMRVGDFNLPQGTAIVPPAKDWPEREVFLTPEMVADLANLKPRAGRMFGYKSRHSIYGAWQSTCKRAGIEYVPPHQAGRHSFATEAVTRQRIDEKTAMDMGGWKSSRLFKETYVHGEGHRDVAMDVFGAGRRRKGRK